MKKINEWAWLVCIVVLVASFCMEYHQTKVNEGVLYQNRKMGQERSALTQQKLDSVTELIAKSCGSSLGVAK